MIYLIEKKSDAQEEVQKILDGALTKEILTSEQTSELHRLKASYFLKQKFEKHEEIYNASVQSLESHQTHYKSWIFWLLFCVQCHRFCNKSQGFKWIENGIKSLPYALRYKPSWMKLVFIDVIKHFERIDSGEIKEKISESLVDEIPIWAWVVWTPNLLNFIVKNGQHLKMEQSLVI